MISEYELLDAVSRMSDAGKRELLQKLQGATEARKATLDEHKLDAAIRCAQFLDDLEMLSPGDRDIWYSRFRSIVNHIVRETRQHEDEKARAEAERYQAELAAQTAEKARQDANVEFKANVRAAGISASAAVKEFAALIVAEHKAAREDRFFPDPFAYIDREASSHAVCETKPAGAILDNTRVLSADLAAPGKDVTIVHDGGGRAMLTLPSPSEEFRTKVLGLLGHRDSAAARESCNLKGWPVPDPEFLSSCLGALGRPSSPEVDSKPNTRGKFISIGGSNLARRIGQAVEVQIYEQAADIGIMPFNTILHLDSARACLVVDPGRASEFVLASPEPLIWAQNAGAIITEVFRPAPLELEPRAILFHANAASAVTLSRDTWRDGAELRPYVTLRVLARLPVGRVLRVFAYDMDGNAFNKG